MKRKIFISFIISSILLLSLGILSIMKMVQLSNLTQELYSHPLAVTNATKTISANLESMHMHMNDIILSDHDQDIDIAIEHINKSEKIVFEQFEVIFDRYLGDADDIQVSYNAFVDWKPIREEIISLAKSGKKYEANESIKQHCSKQMQMLNNYVDKLIYAAQERASDFLKNSIEIKDTAILITAIVTIFIFIVLIIITTTLINHLTKTEKKINNQGEVLIQKEQQLFQQSRMAQMGEMISMIAHQWRQPLGAIAATSIDLNLKMDLNTFDLEQEQGRKESKSYFKEKLKVIDSLVQSLTNTIDDFRNFYKTDKIPDHILINEPLEKALKIIRVSLESENIKIVEKGQSTVAVEVYTNEIMQVFLNIFQNSKDNFKEKKIEDAKIEILVEDTDSEVSVNICDNGGGIGEDILEKIFDPYFSTKSEKNGTGLGLYMSKTIIEEHHRGSFSAQNIENGVCFSIIIKRKDDEN